MFLGKALYFQDYIPHLATMAAPLYELQHKDTPFLWTPRHQGSFEQVKAALTSDTILAQATDEGQFVLRTDASSVCISGVLLLRKPGQSDRPVCYFSHTFSAAQQRWSTFDQELFAILYCITRSPYREILKMRQFIIKMDHRNLQYLSTADADRSPKLLRWKIILLEYLFEIVHISGPSIK